MNYATQVEHRYVSTACMHRVCHECDGRCGYCPAPCLCPHHSQAGVTPSE